MSWPGNGLIWYSYILAIHIYINIYFNILFTELVEQKDINKLFEE